MNHRFLKLIRKQFLVWRLFTATERTHYIDEAKRMLGLPVEEREEETSEVEAGEDPGSPAADAEDTEKDVTDEDSGN